MLSVILWFADSLLCLNVLGSIIGDVLAVRISNKKFPVFFTAAAGSMGRMAVMVCVCIYMSVCVCDIVCVISTRARGSCSSGKMRLPSCRRL